MYYSRCKEPMVCLWQNISRWKVEILQRSNRYIKIMKNHYLKTKMIKKKECQIFGKSPWHLCTGCTKKTPDFHFAVISPIYVKKNFSGQKLVLSKWIFTYYQSFVLGTFWAITYWFLANKIYYYFFTICIWY